MEFRRVLFRSILRFENVVNREVVTDHVERTGERSLTNVAPAQKAHRQPAFAGPAFSLDERFAIGIDGEDLGPYSLPLPQVATPAAPTVEDRGPRSDPFGDEFTFAIVVQFAEFVH